MATLYNLPLKQTGVIRKINARPDLKERLHSFGLIKGVKIEPIRNTPLGCPRIYRCFNTTIAIRNEIAKQIEVTYAK